MFNKKIKYPFHYVTGLNFFNENELKNIYSYPHNSVVWELHSEYFFKQFEAEINYHEDKFKLKNIINDDFISNLKDQYANPLVCTP